MTAPLTAALHYRIGPSSGYNDRIRVRLDPLPFPFALLFFVGFALGVEVRLVGTLYAGEIFLAMFAFFGAMTNLGNTRFWTRDFYRFLGWLTVSCLAYFITDVVIGTPTENLLRGWARIGFLLIDITGLYVICRKNRFNLFPLIVGLALSTILMPHQDTVQAGFAVKWKFDLYFSWTGSVCILAAMAARRKAVLYGALGLGLVGVSSILLDARVVGAICIVVTVVICSQMVSSGRWRKLLVLMLALAAAAGGIATFMLINRTNQQYAARREGSNVARASALLTALQRIEQHPFLGSGSWNVSQEHMDQHRAVTSSLGGKQVSAGMALGHSQILQSAVEAGAFGAAFFIYFLWRLVASSWWVVNRPLDQFSAFAMFNLLMCTWHTLFSAQGGSQRIEIATGVCICLLLSQERALLTRSIGIHDPVPLWRNWR